MNTERIEIIHNKKVTVIFSILSLLVIAGLGTCITLICVNFAGFLDEIGMGMTVIIIVVLSLCTLLFCILFINQVAKLRRNIIFVADENGICDYSRHIALKPIAYSEIRSIEYKEFMDTDNEASEFRHLKIVLKDKHGYMRKLNLMQKISLFFEFSPIELHLFCGKATIKELAEKLKQNLENYNQEKTFNNSF